MRVVRGDLPSLGPAPPAVLTMGSFDGLHRAHQALIARVVAEARARGLAASLVTFEPHPREVLADDRPPVARLTLEEEKLRLLRECGLDLVLLLRFTPELAAWEAGRFLREGLLARCGLRVLVAGDNHAFGHGRGGDRDMLAEAARALAFDLVVVDPVTVGGRRVSSTRVRQALRDGGVGEATALLGRPFRFGGRVVRGEGRGRGLGVPTANLVVDPRQLLPRDGVYAVRVELEDGRRAGGMMNLGPRPTFAETERRPEVHVLDFTGDLYGQRLVVDLVDFVRDTKKFESGAQLTEQLCRDTIRIQDRLSADDNG